MEQKAGVDLALLEDYRKRLEEKARFVFGSPQLKNLLLYLVRELENLQKLITAGFSIQELLIERSRPIRIYGSDYYRWVQEAKSHPDELTKERFKAAEEGFLRARSLFEQQNADAILKLIGISESLRDIMDKFTRLLVAGGQHVISMQAQLKGVERDFAVEKGIKNLKNYLTYVSNLLENLGQDKIFSYREPEYAQLPLTKLITADKTIIKDELRIELELILLQGRLKREKFFSAEGSDSLIKEISEDIIWLHQQFIPQQKRVASFLAQLKKDNRPELQSNLETKRELKAALTEMYQIMERLEANLGKFKQIAAHLYDILNAVEETLIFPIKSGQKEIMVPVESYNDRNRELILTFEKYKVNLPYYKELKELTMSGFRL